MLTKFSELRATNADQQDEHSRVQATAMQQALEISRLENLNRRLTNEANALTQDLWTSPRKSTDANREIQRLQDQATADAALILEANAKQATAEQELQDAQVQVLNLEHQIESMHATTPAEKILTQQ